MHLSTRGYRAARELKHLNAFISIASDDATTAVTAPLNDVFIAVKDNICTKDLPTTCGSRALENFVAPYDATVVERLLQAGATITGKTNLDEFGMGSHSMHSHFGRVKSLFGSRSAGGSSGGSAVAVATKQCHVALGTDTGGSVRLPAAYNGIYGFKPSYGRLSRWGVVAYANSLDTVGILADTPKYMTTVYEVLDAYDKRDPTSMRETTRSRIADLIKARSGNHKLKFGVPEQYVLEEMSAIVRRAWATTVGVLLNAGHSVYTISLPTTEQALSAYYILAPAEASSNLAKYDGVRYGTQATGPQSGPLYSTTRQQGFGEEVRRRILLGAYSLSAGATNNYFLKAQKIRRLVQEDFNRVFHLPNALSETDSRSDGAEPRVDAIICPTAMDVPPTLDDIDKQSPLEAYAGDVLTVPASLAGLPALNVPVPIDILPDGYDGPETVGMQVITQYGDDKLALAIGHELEDLFRESYHSIEEARMKRLSTALTNGLRVMEAS